jgi:hypothetical protein
VAQIAQRKRKMVKKMVTTAIIILLLGVLWVSTWGAGYVQASGLNNSNEFGVGVGAVSADCTKLKLSRPFASLANGKPRITFNIINKGSNTFIQNISFDWAAYHVLRPGQLLQRWRYDDVAIYNAVDIKDSPYNWKKPNTDLLHGESDTFSFEFSAPDAGWPGNLPATAFGLKVFLSNGCTLTFHSITPVTPTVTATITATPSINSTPTVTPTRTPLCIDC